MKNETATLEMQGLRDNYHRLRERSIDVQILPGHWRI
jgi:hypothetical protein